MGKASSSPSDSVVQVHRVTYDSSGNEVLRKVADVSVQELSMGCSAITVPLPEGSLGYYSALYRVTLLSGLLADEDGLDLPGMLPTQWSFRTEPDRVPPRVLQLAPTRGRTDVPTQLSSILFVLDEAVRVSSRAVDDGLSLRIVRSVGGIVTYTALPSRVNVTLRDSRNGGLVADAESPFARSYVSVDLPASAVALDRTEYHVRLDNGLLEDLAGNSFVGFRSTTSWAFSTSDVLPPSVAQSTPAHGATGVAVRLTSAQLKMSEEVQPMPGGRVSVYRKVSGALALKGSDVIEGDSSYAEALAFGELSADKGLFVSRSTDVASIADDPSTKAGRGAGEDGW